MHKQDHDVDISCKESQIKCFLFTTHNYYVPIKYIQVLYFLMFFLR